MNVLKRSRIEKQVEAFRQKLQAGPGVLLDFLTTPAGIAMVKDSEVCEHVTLEEICKYAPECRALISSILCRKDAASIIGIITAQFQTGARPAEFFLTKDGKIDIAAIYNIFPVYKLGMDFKDFSILMEERDEDRVSAQYKGIFHEGNEGTAVVTTRYNEEQLLCRITSLALSRIIYSLVYFDFAKLNKDIEAGLQSLRLLAADMDLAGRAMQEAGIDVYTDQDNAYALLLLDKNLNPVVDYVNEDGIEIYKTVGLITYDRFVKKTAIGKNSIMKSSGEEIVYSAVKNVANGILERSNETKDGSKDMDGSEYVNKNGLGHDLRKNHIRKVDEKLSKKDVSTRARRIAGAEVDTIIDKNIDSRQKRNQQNIQKAFNNYNHELSMEETLHFFENAISTAQETLTSGLIKAAMIIYSNIKVEAIKTDEKDSYSMFKALETVKSSDFAPIVQKERIILVKHLLKLVDTVAFKKPFGYNSNTKIDGDVNMAVLNQNKQAEEIARAVAVGALNQMFSDTMTPDQKGAALLAFILDTFKAEAALEKFKKGRALYGKCFLKELQVQQIRKYEKAYEISFDDADLEAIEFMKSHEIDSIQDTVFVNAVNPIKMISVTFVEEVDGAKLKDLLVVGPKKSELIKEKKKAPVFVKKGDTTRIQEDIQVDIDKLQNQHDKTVRMMKKHLKQEVNCIQDLLELPEVAVVGHNFNEGDEYVKFNLNTERVQMIFSEYHNSVLIAFL